MKIKHIVQVLIFTGAVLCYIFVVTGDSVLWRIKSFKKKMTFRPLLNIQLPAFIY